MGHPVVLRGVVGSTAYGLAREGSDVDRAGIFVAPTLDVAGLHWTAAKETQHCTSEEEDHTYHEVGKALRLMLACNPTVLELLWLPSYERLTIDGEVLVSLRQAVLSDRAVRAAYGGYARAQARKLEAKDGFGTRQAKHGRHLLRLLRQGTELLATRSLTLRVSDPEKFWAFDTMPVDEMLAVYAREDALFAAAKSVLPEKPDQGLVDAALRGIRRRHMT